MNEVMQALACQFRPMVLTDIPEVVQLERLCFHSPWSADTFRLELSGNRFARYWVLTPEPDNDEAKGKAEVIIAKQRNGPVGVVKLTFLEECTHFENYTGRGEGDGALEN